MAFERRGDVISRVVQVVERLRLVVGAQRVGGRQPEHDDRGTRDDARREQRVVCRIMDRHVTERGAIAAIRNVGITRCAPT